MVTVMVIVGVLAAIAAPGWLAFMNSRRANAARDQVLQVLRQSQAQALRSKEAQAIVFNPQAVPPTITARRATETGGIPQPLGNNQFEPGLRVTNGTATTADLRFNADGNLDVASLDPEGIKITVTVPPVTGAKRCVIVQTLLGAMRAGSDTECD